MGHLTPMSALSTTQKSNKVPILRTVSRGSLVGGTHAHTQREERKRIKEKRRAERERGREREMSVGYGCNTPNTVTI